MKKIKSICMITIAMIAITCSQATAQDCNNGKVLNHKQFDLNTLEGKWSTYITNPGFKALLNEVKAKGFKRLEKNDKMSWGFSADIISDTELSTSPQQSEVCAFDFYKKTATGVQFCSMLWRKVGGTVYKAYVIFPEGEKDFSTAFEKSIEYYADDNNKIQKAHSFGRCWSRCLDRRFSSSKCAGAIVGCGAAAAGLVGLGIGVTTPIALGVFGVCAGITCLFPLASCAARCL
jgi:hypothetical protein